MAKKISPQSQNLNPEIHGFARPRIQDLSSEAARLCLKIERLCVDSLGIKPGQSLLLAVSGGGDSTALACIFSLLASRLKLDLHALCIEHGLRNEDVAESEYVAQLCCKLGIEYSRARFKSARLAQKLGCGLEEAGRIGRYRLLELRRRELRADWILLGHQANDLSEDILLRLLRGSGWPALGGMSRQDPRRHIVRPLHGIKPQSLRRLLQECGLAWIEDKSNLSLDFRRNRIRHQILPLLRSENPALERTMATLHELAQCDEKFWAEILADALELNPWEENALDGRITLRLPQALLARMQPALRLRLYLLAIRRFWELWDNAGNAPCAASQARAQTLLSLEHAWATGRGGLRFQFPGGLTAWLKNHEITFLYLAD